MKSLTDYLNESLLNEVSMELIQRAHAKAKERLEQILADGEAEGGSVEKASTKPVFKPETRDELEVLVKILIKERGNKADLNDIDTSLITSMSSMFHGSEFNGDISKWDVSNVKNMSGMFYRSKFNGDISEWDVSNVEDMECMFAHSKFNRNISKWNVRKVKNTNCMFYGSPLEGNEPEWYKK